MPLFVILCVVYGLGIVYLMCTDGSPCVNTNTEAIYWAPFEILGILVVFSRKTRVQSWAFLVWSHVKERGKLIWENDFSVLLQVSYLYILFCMPIASIWFDKLISGMIFHSCFDPYSTWKSNGFSHPGS